jgi:hypothetical protein
MSKTLDSTASLTNARGFMENRNSGMGRIAAAARLATSSDSRRQIRRRCRPLSLRNISTAAPYPTADQPLPMSRAARNSTNASHIGSAIFRIKTVRRCTACQCHLRRPVDTNGCGHRPSSPLYPRKMSFADWLASVIARTQRILAPEEGMCTAWATPMPKLATGAVLTERHR